MQPNSGWQFQVAPTIQLGRRALLCAARGADRSRRRDCDGQPAKNVPPNHGAGCESRRLDRLKYRLMLGSAGFPLQAPTPAWVLGQIYSSPLDCPVCVCLDENGHV